MDQSPNSLPEHSPDDPYRAFFSGAFARANTTELRQNAESAGFVIPQQYTREEIIQTLLDDVMPEGEDIVRTLREGLVAFIDEYWQQLQAQLKCPAKNYRHSNPEKQNPNPCGGCLDMQVVTCVSLLSPQNRQRIFELRKQKCNLP